MPTALNSQKPQQKNRGGQGTSKLCVYIFKSVAGEPWIFLQSSLIGQDFWWELLTKYIFLTFLIKGGSLEALSRTEPKIFCLEHWSKDRGIVCEDNYFVKSDLRLKPLSV